jgi:hypothetical protein
VVSKDGNRICSAPRSASIHRKSSARSVRCRLACLKGKLTYLFRYRCRDELVQLYAIGGSQYLRRAALRALISEVHLASPLRRVKETIHAETYSAHVSANDLTSRLRDSSMGESVRVLALVVVPSKFRLGSEEVTRRAGRTERWVGINQTAYSLDSHQLLSKFNMNPKMRGAGR